MKVDDAIAEILKREGVEFITAYPVNPIIEAAARADIRTIIVRQERTGIHIADGYSRINSGNKIGVFASQAGPGTENSFGGVAQAYGDSSPIVVLPAGYPRGATNVPPHFSALVNFQHIVKSIEQVTMPGAVAPALRRAFNAARNGRPTAGAGRDPERSLRRGPRRARLPACRLRALGAGSAGRR